MKKITDLMTDEMIMDAVKKGNLEKASLLFERYHKRIYNFLAQLGGDRELAEDLTQNVFLRMIRYRNSFRDDSRFTPWIYQIARNVYTDHYQAQKKIRTDTVDVEKISDMLADDNEYAQMDEKEQLLHKSMSMLTDEQRELLVMTRFQHMRYEEVALIMDTTVANIKVKVHRAIGKLREHYFTLART